MQMCLVPFVVFSVIWLQLENISSQVTFFCVQMLKFLEISLHFFGYVRLLAQGALVLARVRQLQARLLAVVQLLRDLDVGDAQRVAMQLIEHVNDQENEQHVQRVRLGLLEDQNVVLEKSHAGAEVSSVIK
jgi:hypothetical protein